MVRCFLFFFCSGFCSLVYQVVWLRAAPAGFGVTTALISIVLSVFAGKLGRRETGTALLGRPAAFLHTALCRERAGNRSFGDGVMRLLRLGDMPAICWNGSGNDGGPAIRGDLLALDPNAPALTDDRPVNEYYFLRRLDGVRTGTEAGPEGAAGAGL